MCVCVCVIVALLYLQKCGRFSSKTHHRVDILTLRIVGRSSLELNGNVGLNLNKQTSKKIDLNYG